MKNLDDVTTKYGNEEELEGTKPIIEPSETKQISKNFTMNTFAQTKVPINKKYFNS